MHNSHHKGGSRLALALAASALASACAQLGPQSGTPNAPEGGAGHGPAPGSALGFVQASCGGCHAVEGESLSPNPQAPPFVDIANREGLDEQSLAAWLRDAHNYPEVMDFDLSQEQAQAVAGHIITLRSSDYRPLPQ